MSKRRIKKHSFKITIPKGTAPEMFAMMFGSAIPGVTIALSAISEEEIVVSCPRHLKVNVRRIAKRYGVSSERAFRPDWGGDEAQWMGGGSAGSR